MNQIESIVPISIFGPVVKFALIKHYKAQIEKCESYQKRSLRNRLVILSANGPLTLSVPLKKGKNNLPIEKVEIAYDEDWQRDHLRSIMSAYGNSPYFEYYYDSIKDIYNQKRTYLMEFGLDTVNFINKILGIDSYKLTTRYIKSQEVKFDMRNKEFNFNYHQVPYFQVFEDKFNFTPNLSILDLIFNLGPESINIINKTNIYK
ncbi:MAG: hypothetical protein HKO66_11960 [Saprospiraceae bacterium]|nr:WbqC family protein [Bacteroidia bacterium]NNL92944.1 hypothetical protein [Saprospiraceae bacterium]